MGNTPNQPSKFKTKNWLEINDESRETYNENNQIRFKISMLRSGLCDYSDPYILVKRTITVAPATATVADNANRLVFFNNCVPLTNCISRINKTHVDDAHDIDLVIPMYNLIEYNDHRKKSSVILWQFARDELNLNDHGEIVDFTAVNTITNSFKIKEKIIDQTNDNDRNYVDMLVPSKYLSSFWRAFEIPLINCEINLDLNFHSG